ncbi:MAG: hypothetical protein ACRC8S_16240 [Fimbriiglobus sp.]
MAKPLVLAYQGQEVKLNIQKVDRTKLYGFVDTEVVDEAGKSCELGTLLGDGHSLVGKGGTGLIYLSQDGLWRKKAELKPVDINGKPITPVKSTFDSVVELSNKVSIEDYLSHNIHLTYQLSPEDAPNEDLLQELKSGIIYHFPFSYRGGVSASAGFLLMGSDGNPFLCVGTPTAIEYVGLKATAAVVPDAETPEVVEDDAMDFSMV